MIILQSMDALELLSQSFSWEDSFQEVPLKNEEALDPRQ